MSDSLYLSDCIQAPFRIRLGYRAMTSGFFSCCRRGRAYVCGAYVCDFCGGAGVTLNTTIQTRAETKRHREGDTSVLE